LTCHETRWGQLAEISTETRWDQGVTTKSAGIWLFLLDYLTDPARRRRVRRGLLKGEQLHALARHVHYGKRGQTEGRDGQQQMSRASCLVLILAAIISGQSREIDPVLRHWDPVEEGLDPTLLPHISPIGWDNVLLYGEYALDPGWGRHPHGSPQHRVANFA